MHRILLLLLFAIFANAADNGRQAAIDKLAAAEAEDIEDEGFEADEEEEEWEDEDDEWELSEDDIRELLKKHYPQRLELLAELEEEDPEHYEELVEETIEMCYEYHELSEHMGEDTAELIFTAHRAESEAWELAEALHNAPGAQRRALLKQVKAKMGEAFDAATQLERAHLGMLKREVRELEAELRSREAERDEILSDELAEIMEEFDEDFEDEDDE